MPKKNEDIFAVEQPLDGDTLALVRGFTEDYATLDLKLSELTKLEKQTREQRDKVKLVILDIMKAHGLKTQKWADGLGITHILVQHPSVDSTHAEQFREWLKENGYWELAKIPAQTLEGLLRERIENKQAVPEYVTSFEEHRLQVRGKSALAGKGD